MNPVEIFQHWKQHAISSPSPPCLLDQIQVQKPILVVATDQIYLITLRSRLLLLRKKNIRPNIWPEIAYDLSFMERKKTSMSNPVKNLGYTNCYSLSSPRTVKKRKNFIRYNCKKICSWSKDLKPYCKSEKRPRFSTWSTTLLFTSFSKTLHVLQVIQRRLTGDVLKTSASM